MRELVSSIVEIIVVTLFGGCAARVQIRS